MFKYLGTGICKNNKIIKKFLGHLTINNKCELKCNTSLISKFKYQTDVRAKKISFNLINLEGS